MATELEKDAVSNRPTRLPRDQRRIQLLDAASEVFAAKGYHAAAMDDIADVAGVSKPVLYQHFPSKLDLYLALLDQSCDRLVEVVEDALASTEENADRVIATVAAFYEFVSSTSGEFRFIFESDLTGDGAVQQRLARVNSEISDAIAEVIAEDTSLPRQQAKLLAVCLVGIAQVSARYWISGGRSAVTLDEAKQLVSNLAWRGISSFPLTEHERQFVPPAFLIDCNGVRLRCRRSALADRLRSPGRQEFGYVVLGRQPATAATARCADSSCRRRETDAFGGVEPASEGDRICAVKDISAPGCVDDRDLKAWLVPTISAPDIAKPHAIRTVGYDHGGSPIIPERIHDRGRFRFSRQAARKSHRQHQMLHLCQRVGLNIRLDVGDDG